MAVYGYVRNSLIDHKKGLDAQKLTVEKFFRKVLEPKGLTFSGFYQDRHADGAKLLTDRTMGHRLNSKLNRGDTVVIARGDRCFPSLRDLIDVAQMWDARGVRLVVCDLGLDTSTQEGKASLAHADQFIRWYKKLRDSSRNEMNARISKGLLSSYSVKGNPRFGWKLEDGDIVPHEGERENCRRILAIFKEKGTLLQTMLEAKRQGIVSCRGKRPYNRFQIKYMIHTAHEILADKPPRPRLKKALAQMDEEERVRLMEEAGYQRPDRFRDRHLKKGEEREEGQVGRELPDERDGNRDPEND